MKTHALNSKIVRVRVIAMAVTDDECRRFADAGSSRTATADAKLVDLFVMGGLLGSYLHDRDWQRNHLRRIYGFTTGWLMSLGVKTPVTPITAERDRQEELFRTGKINYTSASLTVAPLQKFRTIAEEIGEVAEAIDKLEIARHSSTKRERTKHLVEELVQVAAVAVAWLEALEVAK